MAAAPVPPVSASAFYLVSPGPNPKRLAELSTNNGNPQLVLYDSTGTKALVQLAVEANGGFLVINDQAGFHRLIIQLSPQWTLLNLWDAQNGNSAINLNVFGQHDPRVEIKTDGATGADVIVYPNPTHGLGNAARVSAGAGFIAYDANGQECGRYACVPPQAPIVQGG